MIQLVIIMLDVYGIENIRYDYHCHPVLPIRRRRKQRQSFGA